jgi:purine-binding chemotaxis protein CheW
MRPGAAEILQRRARALAVRDEGERATAVETLATFAIGGHHLAVPVAQMVRASPLRHLSEIPGGPPYLLGITAVDGHLVTLLDLAALYQLPRHGVGDVTGVVVVASGAREIGLGAEQLSGIEDVPLRALGPLPGAAGALTRVAHLPPRELLVLDVPLLFDDARLGKPRG